MHRLTTSGGLNIWGFFALVLFAGGMYLVVQAARLIVDSYGLVGAAITVAGIFALGCIIEAQTKSQR